MLPELRAGGVDAVLATVASIEDAHTALTALGGWLELAHDPVAPALVAISVDEIRRAKQFGRPAVILHFQGVSPIEDDPALVDVYARLGVRVVQLT